MRACVISELYPGPQDPTLGIWAHRQAVATRDAGADVEVVRLRRPVPPLSVARDLLRGRARTLRDWATRERGAGAAARLDGIAVRPATFLAPPRPLSYGAWGRFAAGAARRALGEAARRGALDVVHAHYAVPAGRAALGWAARAAVPLVVSVHGGDVYWTAGRSALARREVASTLAAARLVLCNSEGTRVRCEALGVDPARLRVVRLGASAPPGRVDRRREPTVATVGYLVARKRQADLIGALPAIRERIPDARVLVIGDGPERPRLEALASSLRLGGAVDFTGRLEPGAALEALAFCHLMALPSVDEAFGVAYVEAMACGLPAIGSSGEAGPEEISGLGPGLVRVPPGDGEALARAVADLLSEPQELERLGAAARRTASEHFSWERCGAETLAAYREAAA